ncbi:hypothetical protein ASZ90_006612 [hydrocarbon metagenome]|uniref:Uncharacterized protein n=1 Tax=hydrocarbon metagenome TaxID=938273 RepID=A0A0W8FS37_9ZZZZ
MSRSDGGGYCRDYFPRSIKASTPLIPRRRGTRKKWKYEYNK